MPVWVLAPGLLWLHEAAQEMGLRLSAKVVMLGTLHAALLQLALASERSYTDRVRVCSLWQQVGARLGEAPACLAECGSCAAHNAHNSVSASQ